jgi:hypothetical protein
MRKSSALQRDSFSGSSIVTTFPCVAIRPAQHMPRGDDDEDCIEPRTVRGLVEMTMSHRLRIMLGGSGLVVLAGTVAVCAFFPGYLSHGTAAAG